MRLAGKEKGGFYPTMPIGLAQIVRHIRYTPGKRVRVLDPCAGKGEALIAATQNAIPYQQSVEMLLVELNGNHRWDINYNLRANLEHAQILNCAWEDVILNEASVGLLWLNPPYDWEALKTETDDPTKLSKLVTERVEYAFLKSSTPKLQPGGLLIYIVPLSVIQRKQVLRYLATHYERFHVRSVPDPEYAIFDQVVVFACKKNAVEQDPEATDWLADQVKTRPTPLSKEDDFSYHLPEASEKLVFRKNQLTYSETAALVTQHGAHLEPAWQTWGSPKSQVNFRPAGPPKLGHVATFITSGMFGVVNLGTSVIRGAATKRTLAYDAHGNQVPVESKAAVELRERYDTEIYQLLADGTFKTLTKPEELEQLLREHIELLHAMVLQQFNPLYNGDPSREEWDALAALMPKKRLPGRKSAGLLLAQKHAIVTMKRVLERFRTCFLIADMGCGKGPMGYAIAESVNAFPLLVICPPHLVEKHAREAKDTLGVAIKTVIVTKASELFRAIDEYEPGQKLIVIAGITTWSLGPGVHRVRVMKKIFRQQKDPETGLLTGKWEAVTREVCPRCGKPVDPDISKSNKPVKCPECKEPLYEYGGSPKQYAKSQQVGVTFNQWAEAQADLALAQRKHQRTSIHRWPLATVLSKKVRKGFFKGLIADEMHKFKAKGTDRGYAFQRLVNAVKYTINTTGTIFGGYASDLFYLLYRTMPAFRKQFGFDDVGAFVDRYGKRKYAIIQEDDDYGISTGKRRRIGNVKDLPGISPSIYPLILQQALFMRVADLGYDLPGYTEEMPTVVMEDELRAQYVWLHTTLYEEIRRKMSSFNSADMKDAMRLLSTWLVNTLYRPQSAFRSEIVMRPSPQNDKDAGIHLQVPYRVRKGTSEQFGHTDADDQQQRVIELEIDDPATEMSEDIAKVIMHQPRQGNVNGQQRIIELEIDSSEAEMSEDITNQDVRGKPAAAVAFDESVQGNVEAMVLYPAVKVGQKLPKEAWLVDEVAKQVKAGQKVLIYVEQTAKRNIQPRLKRLLTASGVRVLVLPDGNARKREEWIARRVDEIDVLITNPRKVETGLDLVQFNVLIFYELPTSLFVLQQAMKRVWRLGQTRDVLVLIPYHIGYGDMMERRIIGLMAEKVRSAALLYGENASSAFADEATGGDITADIAKQIMAEAAGQAPEHFADGIKSLLGDLVAEELAASAAARQAAIDAGEESAGTGELEEEEEEEDEEVFAASFGEDEEDEAESDDQARTPQLDLFDFGAFDEVETTGEMETTGETETTGEPSVFDLFASPTQGTAPMPTSADALVDPYTVTTGDGTDLLIQPLVQKAAIAATPADQKELGNILTSGRDAVLPTPQQVTRATNSNWTPQVDDLVYIDTFGDYRRPENLWTIDKIEGSDYWLKRVNPPPNTKANRRRCNRFQLIKAEEPHEITQTPDPAQPAAASPGEPPAAPPAAPSEPEAVYPGKLFTLEGREYRLCRFEYSGQPYDQTPISAKDETPGLPMPNSRAWSSITQFIQETGFRFIPFSGYTHEDLRAIREKIAVGNMVLLAYDIGVPTIHNVADGLPEARHLGFGFFDVKTPDLEFNFDGGGAMQRQGAISWSPLCVTKGTYAYPFEQALAAIDWWLNVPEPPTPESQPTAALVATGAPETNVIEVEVETDSADSINPTKCDITRPASTDFFDAWDLDATQPATDLTVLALTPKKGGGKRAAKAIGQNDAFRRMMTSEPKFK